MNHLDVGFDGIMPIVGFGYNVVNKYFDIYYPAAIQVATQLKQLGGAPQLIYTTHPWLVSLYLDCPSHTEWGSYLHCPNETMLSAFKSAVQQGFIAWHAYPFNTEPEMYDGSLFSAGLSIGKGLSSSFGLSAPNTMSQRDVPGMTRSVIPLLVAQGIKAITIGVNGASAPPATPNPFVWKDPVSGASILGMMHPGGYGGIGVADCVIVDGFEHALAPAFRSDNQGPPPLAEVQSNWATLQQEFPNANIIASTWDTFTNLLATVSSQLPVIDGEMGDTWIHGCASDPLKVAQFRALMQIRYYCISDGRCDPSDPEMMYFDRMLLKIGEHTWGLDVKTFLNDTQNWTNVQFEAARSQPNYQLLVEAWIEQRSFLYNAVAALGNSGRYGELAREMNDTLDAIAKPVLPSTSGFQPISNFSQVFSAGDYSLQFDAATGAIASLLNTKTNVQYAGPNNLLALFQYQTYNQNDYNNLFEEYFYFDATPTSWAAGDFGKPNCTSANPTSATYLPSLEALFYRVGEDGKVFLLELSMPKDTWTLYGAPPTVWVQVTVASSSIGWAVWAVNKTSTRLPEALFFSFNPLNPTQATWSMSKLGEWISPSEIMSNGSFHVHGVDFGGIKLGLPDSDVVFQSPDTPLVSLGAHTAFPTPFAAPDMSQGFSFLLYNNIWGTNYIMWYPYLPEDATSAYHFMMTLQQE